MNNPKLLHTLMLIAGLMAFLPVTYQPWQQFFLTQKWQQTTCTITQQSQSNIIYRYQFNNQTYTNSKLDLVPDNFMRKIDTNKLMQKFPENSTHTCYVNPINPMAAVIERTMDWYYLVSVIPLLFIIIGLSGLKSNQVQIRTSARSPGYYELAIEASPFAQFIAAIIFVVAATGVTALIYYQYWLVDYKYTHSIPIIATLFLVCFGFAAILSALAVVYQFLNLFNPRTILKTDSRTFKRGQDYQIRFQLDGRFERLRTLTINLICKEMIRARGKNDRQKDTIVYEHLIYQCQSARIPNDGEFDFVIPDDKEPSHIKANREIAWFIVAEGKVNAWPDMKNVFKIEVQ